MGCIQVTGPGSGPGPSSVLYAVRWKRLDLTRQSKGVPSGVGDRLAVPGFRKSRGRQTGLQTGLETGLSGATRQRFLLVIDVPVPDAVRACEGLGVVCARFVSGALAPKAAKRRADTMDILLLGKCTSRRVFRPSLKPSGRAITRRWQMHGGRARP